MVDAGSTPARCVMVALIFKTSGRLPIELGLKNAHHVSFLKEDHPGAFQGHTVMNRVGQLVHPIETAKDRTTYFNSSREAIQALKKHFPKARKTENSLVWGPILVMKFKI